MLQRVAVLSVVVLLASAAYSVESSYAPGENWSWSYGGEDVGGGSSYLGVDIADVTSDRLGALKLKEEHGAEVTMVDQDAPAGKAGLKEHDVILTLNGTAVESAAQLRRMIRETPGGRVVSLGLSRDGSPLTLKVQLASRGKMVAMANGDKNFKFAMPALPTLPSLPEFDVPVSIVIAHSSMRSGLMVENLTPQLGEFFGVKSGNGVLIRSVEKGSRADKAGFRAGDVVVKVNTQPVRDSSDFTRALRTSAGKATSVTVVRDKREQTFTLTLPDKSDSGAVIEESFDSPDLLAGREQLASRLQGELAKMQPALNNLKQQAECWQKNQEKWQQAWNEKKKDMQEKVKESQRKMRQETEKRMHELKGEWAEI